MLRCHLRSVPAGSFARLASPLALWRALRERGITVIGATSKRAALDQADKVLILAGGTVLDQGLWADLQQQWGHLAG